MSAWPSTGLFLLLLGFNKVWKNSHIIRIVNHGKNFGALYKLYTYHRGEKTTKQTNQQTNPTTAKILTGFEEDGVLHNLF